MRAVVAAPRQAAFDALATLFEYPSGMDWLGDACVAVDRYCPRSAAHLESFASRASRTPLATWQETFVSTFELNPVCALEIGWQTYGEQYARGTFIVRMQQLMRDAALPPTTELADHITNVLRVLGRISGPSAVKLARAFTLPAIDKMRQRLGTERVNPYCGLLDATAALLEDYDGREVAGE